MRPTLLPGLEQLLPGLEQLLPGPEQLLPGPEQLLPERRNAAFPFCFPYFWTLGNHPPKLPAWAPGRN